MNPLIRDELLKATIALPAGALTVQTAGIEVHSGAHNTEYLAERSELVAEAPALTTAQLPNAETVTYTIEGSNDNATFVQVTGPVQLVQTGAGGVGAAAGTLRYRPPTNAYRYYRAKAVKTGAASAAAASLVFSVVH